MYAHGWRSPIRSTTRRPRFIEKQVEAGEDRYQTPEWLLDGFPDEATAIAEEIYETFNKEHGTDYKFQLKP